MSVIRSRKILMKIKQRDIRRKTRETSRRLKLIEAKHVEIDYCPVELVAVVQNFQKK